MDEKRAPEAAVIRQRDLFKQRVKVKRGDFRVSKDRYCGIAENMHEMVCRFLPHGTVTFANRACQAYRGGGIDELTGNNFFQWIKKNNEDRKVEEDFQACVVKANTMPYPVQMFKCDGSTCWIRWSGHRLFDEHGSLLEYQAVGRDITAIKRAHEDKFEHEKWRRRTQKLEAIGTLSAGIAHDLNNITAVILGNVQLAMDDVPKGTRARKNLDEIYDSCIRARNMVKQILTFAREGDRELMPLSLVPVVKESIKFLKSAIPSTIEIREEIHEVDFVKADPTQIGQVVMNLGTNATHAMGGEPGIMNISLENINIHDGHEARFRVPEAGKYVRLKVSDTGCGMSEKVVARIFDPYFTTKQEDEGTGMGLAVVHGIIETHNGTAWVESEPGKGSTFHILFPVVDAADLETVIDHYQPVLKGTERILVVDDENALLEAEVDMLERLGYEVTGKSCPMEALKTFRGHPDRFDLLYTDMTMPGMTGLTLAKKIMGIRPHMPVILYSGHRSLATDNKILKSGIKAFLTKPITMEKLAAVIREVLDEAKTRKSS